MTTETYVGTDSFGEDPAPVDRDQIARWVRRAIGDPGSIAGRRRGPSWGQGAEGYAEQQETVTEWAARAVLRVLGHGGQPWCERCSRPIDVDDDYAPPLPGVGLWEHRGDCPAVDWTVYTTWRAGDGCWREDHETYPDWPSARRQARRLICLADVRYVSVQGPEDVVVGEYDRYTNRWREYRRDALAADRGGERP